MPYFGSPELEVVECVRAPNLVDVIPGKRYRVQYDPKAIRHMLLRVIDESGESYLYPADYFMPSKL